MALIEGPDYHLVGVDYDEHFRQLLQRTFDDPGSGRWDERHAWLWAYLDGLFDVVARHADKVMHVIDGEVRDAQSYAEAHGIAPPPLYACAFEATSGFLTVTKTFMYSNAEIWCARFAEPVDPVDDKVPPALKEWLKEESSRAERQTTEALAVRWKEDNVLRRILTGRTGVALDATCGLQELLECDLTHLASTGGHSGRDFPEFCRRFLTDRDDLKSVPDSIMFAVFGGCTHNWSRSTLKCTSHVLTINHRWQIKIDMDMVELPDDGTSGGARFYGPPPDDSSTKVHVSEALPAGQRAGQRV